MSNENIKLNFLHVCDYASLSQGGKLNILGIFKNISGSKFPITHPQMFIVSNIAVDSAGSYKQAIKLVRKEDGQEIKLQSSLEFNLISGGQAELGVIGQLNNVVFEKPGHYEVQIYVNEVLLGRAILTLLETQ